MKKNLFLNLIVAFALFWLLPSTVKAVNPTYICEIRNDAQISSTEYIFDVYIVHTNPGAAATFELAGVQAGFTYNFGVLPAGAVMTATIVDGFSNLALCLQPKQANLTVVATGIKMTLAAPQCGAGNGTILSTVAPGNCVTRIKLTSSLPFTANSQFNINWSFAAAPWPSKVYAYLPAYTNVTVNANHVITNRNNPVLNPPAAGPTAYAVTGGGSYCQGGVGLPVGVANSEVGVTYTITPGGATVAGTGSAVSFGNRLAGTYTVSGTNAGGTTPMTGSAVITENTPVTPTFAQIGPFCVGDAGSLALTSINGYTGTWSPAFSTATSGTTVYTFTPAAGQCATTATMSVVVNAPVTPTFAQLGPYNQGTVGVFLPTTSTNGVVGTWSPAQVNTAVLGASLYTFTPTGACAIGTTMNITINAVTPSAATWTGAVSSSWFVAGNWNPAVPGAITAVTIPAATSVPNSPTLTAAASCASILINDGGSFIGSEFLTVGTVSVKRTFVNNKWHFLSSPVVSNTFGQVFSNSVFVWAKEWNPTTSLWVYKTGAQSFVVGKGYSVGTSNPPAYANFTGTLNSTPVTTPLVFNGASNPTWNLLGNPFQSAINWNDVIRTGSVGGAVAVYNGTGYQYYNGTVGQPTFNGIIPAENGFFVTTTAAGASVTVPLIARVHSTAPFYKESVANALALEANGNGSDDQMYVHFNDNATAAYDSQFDAMKMWGSEEMPQLYSTTSNESLAINELPLEGNEVVNVGFKCNTTGQYSLNATGIETFDYSTPIILEDLKLNTKQDLRKNAVYSFNYDAADDANRFKLHFKSTTGINDPTNSGISVYSFVSDVVINNSTSLAGEVWVYDMAGRELAHSSLSSQAKTTIQLQVAVGAYMVKVVTAKATVNQKVFIK